MLQVAFYALLAYVFTIPWENIITIPGVGTLSRYVGILAIGISLLAILLSGNFKMHRAHIWALGFVLFSAISFWWTVDPEETMIRVPQYGLLFAFFWALFNVVETPLQARQILIAYVLGAYVACLDTIQNFLSGSTVVYQRYAAANFDPGDLSFVLALAVPMSWYLALNKENSRLVWVYRLYPLMAIAVILLTAARAGLIGVAVGLGFMAITLPRASWRIKGLAIVAVLTALWVIPTFIPQESLDRLATLGEEIGSGTLNDRTNIWNAGFDVFSEHIFLGTGAATFGADMEDHPWFRRWTAPHNLFVGISTEMGMVGIVILFMILLEVFLCAIQMPPLERMLWLTEFVILFLAFMAQNWEFRKQLWFIWGMILTHYKVLWNYWSRYSEKSDKTFTAQATD